MYVINLRGRECSLDQLETRMHSNTTTPIDGFDFALHVGGSVRVRGLGKGKDWPSAKR